MQANPIDSQRPLQFSTNWYLFRGMAFGMQQPTIRGELCIGRSLGGQLSRLESIISSHINEQAPIIDDHDEYQRFAQLVVFWIGALQRQCGIPVSERNLCLPEARASGSSDQRYLVFDVIMPYLHEAAVAIAMRWMTTLFRLAADTQAKGAPGTETDELADRVVLDRIYQDLKAYGEEGINTYHIMQAANRLDIPLFRLGDRMFMLGTGQYACRMDSTLTDQTSPLGIHIARNKMRTARFLNTMGLPGARHSRVTSREEALGAARRIGYPVVIKPADQQRGKGVCADIRDEQTLTEAFDAARQYSENILVEKWVDGFTHRLTVFQGQVIRITKRVAGGVVGDGTGTVSDLIKRWQEQEDNRDRARRLGRFLLELDTEARGLLRQHGIDEQHVPAAGEYIRLRRRDNINAGGHNEYLSVADAHEDNLRLAVAIARLLRLDFAGVDLIIGQINQSWLATEALVCEVNAQPQMGTRNNESIYQEVLTGLMGDRCRIPACLVIGYTDSENTRRTVSSLLEGGSYNGLSLATGLKVDGHLVTKGFSDSFLAARALLQRVDVRAAICCMSPDDVVRFGLPLDRWDRIEIVVADKARQSEAGVFAEVRSIVQEHGDRQSRGGEEVSCTV
ncbi:MAG: cyanophycin synthetase [Gammaproteobacteria bacterium]